MFRFIFVFIILILSSNLGSSEFHKGLDTIELRKSAMQGMWLRIKRLSPYLDFDENIEYGPELAKQDAQDISLLLEQTKDLWPVYSNLSTKNYTNATPAVWVLPDYFNKLYTQAMLSSKNLETFLTKGDIEGSEEAMCNLGNACGTCHSSFRRLLTSDLANEVSAWSGKYIKNCKN